MDEKTRLLISIGASVASNCVPCFEYYFKKSSTAGITSEELEETIELACKVKTGSAITMKKSIREITGEDREPEPANVDEQDHPCCM